MILRLFIFLLLYAAGGAIGSVFADSDHGFKAIAECDVVDGFNIEDCYSESPGLDGGNLFGPAVAHHQLVVAPSGGWPLVHDRSAQGAGKSQRPIYLLLHSFLFYELT